MLPEWLRDAHRDLFERKFYDEPGVKDAMKNKAWYLNLASAIDQVTAFKGMCPTSTENPNAVQMAVRAYETGVLGYDKGFAGRWCWEKLPEPIRTAHLKAADRIRPFIADWLSRNGSPAKVAGWRRPTVLRR